MNPLEEDSGDPELKRNDFQSPGGALEQSNEQNEIVFIYCSLFLIS